ncbi:hypothetical protein LTR37_017605 [Vermiconidia calcicola]|uniref:Uncharacterized protein n=1 Tax=Vermiconidia calcicola TaxID=1690605 RepID=A0ACC3ML39_9PEZI|nr:hypothetical protein LTR37_017605 [Vermiconidia calcicola]
MASMFHVELASEEELPDLVGLIIPTFAHYGLEQLVGNFNTPEGIKAATERHLRAWRDHVEETGRPLGVKCLHQDAASGQETMVACAYWAVFDRPRSPEDMEKVNYLLSGAWLPEEQRVMARARLQPVLDMRTKWLAGRGHAILMYMATDTAWRRQGAATAVVQWGLDLCKELGIVAYLEASEEGRPVYQKLGFEVVEEVEFEPGEVGRAMIWWPLGTKEDDKRPMEA